MDGEEDSPIENNADSTSSRSDTSGKRQIRKNDSGVGDDASDRCTDDVSKKIRMGDDAGAENTVEFPRINSKIKNRSYRRYSQPELGNGDSSDVDPCANAADDKDSANNLAIESRISSDSALPDVSIAPEQRNSAPEDEPIQDVNTSPTVPEEQPVFETEGSYRRQGSVSSSSDSFAMEEDEDADNNETTPSVLLKDPPKHKWFMTPEIVNRQFGFSNRKQGSELFQQRMYGSLHAVQRLELMYKLDKHRGCVNTINFNETGNLLVSGSDDLHACVWDWAVGKLLTQFETGHKSNVLQVKFLPLSGGMHIATCARDGQVRFTLLSSDGQPRCTKRLAQHRGPSNRLATHKDMPHVVLSCGDDALVMRLDVRQPRPEKVLFVKEERKISLYGVHLNPMNSKEFLVCGKDTYIRIFDLRNTSSPVKRLCPQHLSGSNLKHNLMPFVTSAVFNHNGTEVLGSYSDDDVYLFDTRHSEGCDYVHRYQGHRNNATVKGVNFFGPRSEFVVSGSDCGNIYFWERETEAIVQWMAGDENGVVNGLEPHPTIPLLATCGLDEDVKIWVPSCEQGPTFDGLVNTVLTNVRGRDGDRSSGYDSIDGQMLWIMWRHIRRTERMRDRLTANGGRSSSSGDNVLSPFEDSSSDSSFSEEENSTDRLQCHPS